MATESSIQVAPDGSGKKLDTFIVLQPDGVTLAHRESVVVTDANFAGGAQTVSLAGEAFTHDPVIEDLLTQMLIEMRVMNTILATTLNSRDDAETLRANESAVTLQQTQ